MCAWCWGEGNSPISKSLPAAFFAPPVLRMDFMDVLDFFCYGGVKPDLAFFRCAEAARTVRPVA